MAEFQIKTLNASDIEVRVDQVYKDNTGKPTGGRYLLYKDARCDMRVLDETFGVFGWQRDHKELNGVIYCGISVQSPHSGEWVTKWDCGSESKVAADKGAASDSFKRACVCLGIGRELYTAPQIKIDYDDYEASKGGIWGLRVSEVAYDANRHIVKLVIVDGRGNVRFTTEKAAQPAKTSSKAKAQPAAAAQPTAQEPPQDDPNIVISKKINVVNLFLNHTPAAVAYYEQKLAMPREQFTSATYCAIYENLLAGGKVTADYKIVQPNK